MVESLFFGEEVESDAEYSFGEMERFYKDELIGGYDEYEEQKYYEGFGNKLICIEKDPSCEWEFILGYNVWDIRRLEFLKMLNIWDDVVVNRCTGGHINISRFLDKQILIDVCRFLFLVMQNKNESMERFFGAYVCWEDGRFWIDGRIDYENIKLKDWYDDVIIEYRVPNSSNNPYEIWMREGLIEVLYNFWKEYGYEYIDWDEFGRFVYNFFNEGFSFDEFIKYWNCVFGIVVNAIKWYEQFKPEECEILLDLFISHVEKMYGYWVLYCKEKVEEVMV